MRFDRLYPLAIVAVLSVMFQPAVAEQNTSAGSCKAGSACVSPGGAGLRDQTNDSQDVIVGTVRRQTDVRNGFGSRQCQVAGASECVAPMAAPVLVVPYPQVSFPTVSFSAGSGVFATWGSLNAASLSMVCGNNNGSVFNGTIDSGATNSLVAGSASWPAGTYVCTIVGTNSVGRQASASQTLTVTASSPSVGVPSDQPPKMPVSVAITAQRWVPAITFPHPRSGYAIFTWQGQNVASLQIDCVDQNTSNYAIRAAMGYNGSASGTGQFDIPSIDAQGNVGPQQLGLPAGLGVMPMSPYVAGHTYQCTFLGKNANGDAASDARTFTVGATTPELYTVLNPIAVFKSNIVAATFTINTGASSLQRPASNVLTCATSGGVVVGSYDFSDATGSSVVTGTTTGGTYRIGNTAVPIGSTDGAGLPGWPVGVQVRCVLATTDGAGFAARLVRTVTAVAPNTAASDAQACSASTGCVDDAYFMDVTSTASHTGRIVDLPIVSQ